MQKKIISFPRMGNYHVPIEFLLKKLTNYETLLCPNITKKTLDLGSKYSPDFVCVPFKYNLGNFIEALEKGANVLMQAGGGCRYGYYAEVQEQILKDLGYNFEMISLFESGKPLVFTAYKSLRKINNKLPFLKFIYYLCITIKMIHYMDDLDIYIRSNIGFEEEKGSFDLILANMLKELTEIKGFWHLRRVYKKYNKMFKSIKIYKPNNCLRVGIIGELYTSMEPVSSYFIEKTLANMGVEISRYTDVTYLLITKQFNEKKILKMCGKYCKYLIGADGTDNIAVAKKLIEEGYHGLIHTKPFGCTPEIGAMSILQRLSNDYNVPIIYLSFDSHTSEEGIKTRLEAFYDMIKIKEEKK
jgi:predicted nucleotide-binding protein (sugar kinase/HSP70/actin superfamily)